MQAMDQPILIAGGGIAGLSTALCLHHFGFRAHVFEQAQAFSQAGAGIQLTPNAMQVFEALGLGEALQDRAYSPDAIALCEKDTGQTRLHIALQDAQRRWGATYKIINRTDLIHVLSAALCKRVPDSVHMGCRLRDCRNDPQQAVMELDNGQTLTGPLLIGADGHKSMTRQWMEPIVKATKKQRYLVLRAQIPAGPKTQSLARIPSIWAGDGRHIVTYSLHGETAFNFVGIVPENLLPKNIKLKPDTSIATDMVLSLFADLDTRLVQLISGSEPMQTWTIYQRKAPKHWYKDRIVLSGDACHTLLPFMAQGAAMAVEDAWVLAKSLAGADNMEQALSTYQYLRASRVRNIMRRSRRQGQLYHAKGIGGKPLRAVVSLVAHAFPSLIVAQLDRVFGYDVTQNRVPRG